MHENYLGELASCTRLGVASLVSPTQAFSPAVLRSQLPRMALEWSIQGFAECLLIKGIPSPQARLMGQNPVCVCVCVLDRGKTFEAMIF